MIDFSKHYNKEYFNWQKKVGIFGAKANMFKFSKSLKHDLIILDYGCNDCFFSTMLSPGYTYYGIDSNKELLNKKIKIYSRKFFFLQKNILPFKKEYFDCILLSHVLPHIYEPKKLIKKLEKIIKKNGIIIIVCPNKIFKFLYFFFNIFNNYVPDETISKHYSPNDTKNLFDNNKTFHFTVEDLDQIINRKNNQEKISLATFYNTVHSFKKAGHLKEILTRNNKSYFDTHTGPHHHFFDSKNNTLTDIDSKKVKIKNIPEAPQGKKIKDVDVVINIENGSH